MTMASTFDISDDYSWAADDEDEDSRIISVDRYLRDFHCPPGTTMIFLFHGEEYAGGWEYGSDIEFGFNLFKAVGKFASNAVKTAGKQLALPLKPIQKITGEVGKVVKKIPVVGGPLKAVLDSTYTVTFGVVDMSIAVAVDGKRIDKVLMSKFKEELKNFKQIAPYAQMVISVIPGIGIGVSAALSAGLALAEGQSITEVLKAGLIGAIPGGPLVKAAVTMGVETIQHVAKGEKVDFNTIAQTAAGVASSALGLPMAAKNALMGGITIAGSIASGKSIDKAVTDGVIKALPVSDQIKRTMTEATALSLDLAHGKRLDVALTSRLQGVVKMLPANNPLADNVKNALAVAQKAGGKNTPELLHAALNSGLSDVLMSAGAKTLPANVQKTLKSGIALGQGVFAQGKRKDAIGRATGKLIQSSVELAKTSPLFREGRKIASKAGPQAAKGFDVGTGLLTQQAKLYDISVVRNNMKPQEKKGFDMAVALRIGAVSSPKPPNVTPAAHAGFAITTGMQSYVPQRKAEIMKTVAKNPSAATGATVAIKQVAAERKTWLIRLLEALGFRSKK